MEPENISFGRFVEELGHLTNRLQALRNRIPHPDGDARHVALVGIQEILVGSTLAVAGLINGRTINEVVRVMGQPQIPQDRAIRLVESALRLGAITECHFRYDALVGNLLKAFELSAKRKFLVDVERLWHHVHLPTSDGHIDGLRVWTHIRNSSHNNSMHRNASFSTTIDGVAFSFATDSPVQCASRNHMLIVARKVLTETEALILAPSVQSLPGPLPDDFSDAVARGDASV